MREAGVGDEFERALEISRAEYERLAEAGLRDAAPYALCLAYRIRYVLDLNAREAMHLIELRSGREGHPAYRAVAQAMHERIDAIHPAVAAAMGFVDTSREPRLERILSEIRTQRKQGRRRPTAPRRRLGSTRSVDRSVLPLFLSAFMAEVSVPCTDARDVQHSILTARQAGKLREQRHGHDRQRGEDEGRRARIDAEAEPVGRELGHEETASS